MELKHLSPEEASEAQQTDLFFLFPKLEIRPRHAYLIAVKDGQALGVAELYNASSNLHLEMLEVAEEAREQGVATAILEEVFAQAKQGNLTVTHNGFTPHGQKYLLHMMNRMGAESGVGVESIGRC